MRQADRAFWMPVAARVFRDEDRRRAAITKARRAASRSGFNGRVSLSYTDLHGRLGHIIIITIHAAAPTKGVT